MPFPVGVDTVVVSAGPMYAADGSPRKGVRLRATLSQVVTIVADGSVLPSQVTSVTDDNGTASLTLAATDSAGLTPTGFTYRLECDPIISPGGISVSLPTSNPAVNVRDLVAVPESPGVFFPASSFYSVVEAGSNLTTPRPLGAVVVHWRFSAGTDPGAQGVNILNAQPGDTYYVATA